MSNKPVVEFSQELVGPVKGERAAVYAVTEHHTLGPVFAPRWINTSMVVRVDDDGSFETLNTYYKKVQREA